MDSAPGSTREVPGDENAEADFLRPNPYRWVMFPINYDLIWRAYKLREMDIWNGQDLSLAPRNLRNQTVAGERLRSNVIKTILCRYRLAASPHGPLIRVCNLLAKVEAPEARAYYGLQLQYETVVGELLEEMHQGLNPTLNTDAYDCVLTTDSWNRKYQRMQAPNMADSRFTQLLLDEILYRTIFHASLHAIHYQAQESGIYEDLPMALQRIEKTLFADAEFAVLLYTLIENKLDKSYVAQAFDDAIAIEMAFATENLEGVDFDDLEMHCYYLFGVYSGKLGQRQARVTRTPYEFYPKQLRVWEAWWDLPLTDGKARDARACRSAADEAPSGGLDDDF